MADPVSQTTDLLPCPFCGGGVRPPENPSGTDKYLDFVFDRPPSPEGARFIEVEDGSGRSVNIGEWVKRSDELWALRISMEDLLDGISQRKGSEI